MRQIATVLYVTDAAGIDEDFDEGEALGQLGLDEGWTLFAAEATGWFGVQDAQRLLIERGASTVLARTCRLGPTGELELFGEPLRVFG